MRRKNEVLVGVLLTVALAVGVLGTIWLVRGGFKSGYPLYAVFPWGENLKVGQPVRVAGVQVGYVGDVVLNDNGTLYVVMKIEEIVEAVGIFGDAQIALRATPSAQSYQPNDTVPAGKAAAGVPELMAKADSVLAVTVNVSHTLETQLVKDGGIDDVRRTLALTADLTARLNTVAAEQSRELTQTQRRLRSTLAAIDSGAVDSTVKSLRTTAANMAKLTADFQTTSGRINSLLAKVDSGGGTAAMLINDPGLYNDLRRLTTRLDSLTADFKKNPRRYINLEIF